MTSEGAIPLFTKELQLSYLLMLIAAALSLGAQFILPSQVPLWYSLAIPEQQLVPKFLLFVFPATMLIICLLHTTIINNLRKKDHTIVKIFSFGTTLTSFLFLIGLGHIIYLFL